MAERIQFLRGVAAAPAAAAHPVVELTEAELRMIVGGEGDELIDDGSDEFSKKSKGTGSYSSSSTACCDGVKVCCI